VKPTAPDQPAGVSDSYWLPFTPTRAFLSAPRLVTSARGMSYTTSDGRTVLDASSGLYCVNAGHGRPEIADAIAEAARRLDYAPAFQFAHPDVFALTDELAALAPGDLDHVLLACSGSEAVETALKVALAVHHARGEPGRRAFIGRERGYHGVCFGGISVGGIANNRRAFGNGLSDTRHLRTTFRPDQQAYSIGEPAWGGHLADDLEQIIADMGVEAIAGVIVEPVAGSTGCLPPPKGYLERLRDITGKHGLLLIFDEVITGFGRLGYAFAAERYGIVPDMIVFAKGVTNGAAPLSGVLVRRGLRDAVLGGPDHLPELFHGFTYSGHPLGVAAARAALGIYRREGLFDRARAMEPRFAARLAALRGVPLVTDVRPIGLMCGIDIEPDPAHPGLRGFAAMRQLFHDQSIYVRVAMDTLIVAPPLIADDADIDEICVRIARVLSCLADPHRGSA
jgi:beta-alanine--pyruvate transaminase